MGVFREFNISPKFYLRNCCAVYNAGLCCTMLYRESIAKTVFLGMVISIIKIRWLWDHLIFIIEIPTMVKQCLNIETTLCPQRSPLNWSLLWLHARKPTHTDKWAVFSWNGDFHYKDKMVVRPSYLYNWNPYNDETMSQYWNHPSVHTEAHWTEASYGFMLDSPHKQTNGPGNETFFFLSCHQTK